MITSTQFYSSLWFALLVGIIAAEKLCTYTLQPNAYIPLWAPGYAQVKFKNFQDARVICDRSDTCRGITQTQQPQKPGFTGPKYDILSYFTLRSSTEVITQVSASQDIAYLKTSCTECDFEVAYGTQLVGCFDSCIDYETLTEAQTACREEPDCGGITLSTKELGGSSTTSPIGSKFGFQLRISSTPMISENREDSWVKRACKISFIEGHHKESGLQNADYQFSH